jgi:hypothetical protein
MGFKFATSVLRQRILQLHSKQVWLRYVTPSGAAVTTSNHSKVRWSKCQLRCGSFLSLPTRIVNLMLSSQSSLAVRCLTQGELTKAKQVIEVSAVSV